MYTPQDVAKKDFKILNRKKLIEENEKNTRNKAALNKHGHPADGATRIRKKTRFVCNEITRGWSVSTALTDAEKITIKTCWSCNLPQLSKLGVDIADVWLATT